MKIKIFRGIFWVPDSNEWGPKFKWLPLTEKDLFLQCCEFSRADPDPARTYEAKTS